MKIEVWNGEDEHYYTYETDDITIDDVPLLRTYADIRKNAIEEFIKEIQSRPLVNFFQMLELMEIADELKK